VFEHQIHFLNDLDFQKLISMIIYIIRIKKVIKIKLYLRYGDTYLVSKSKICEKVKYNVYPISMRLKLTKNHRSFYCNIVFTLKKISQSESRIFEI